MSNPFRRNTPPSSADSQVDKLTNDERAIPDLVPPANANIGQPAAEAVDLPDADSQTIVSDAEEATFSENTGLTESTSSQAPKIGQEDAPKIGQEDAPKIGQEDAPEIGQGGTPKIGQEGDKVQSPADFLVPSPPPNEAFLPQLDGQAGPAAQSPIQPATTVTKNPTATTPSSSNKRLPLILAIIAIILALLAVLAAFGLIPVSTVGTSQIKNDAITGSKVKPKSLYANSFGGTLPAGPQGPKGEPGTAGPRGPRGQAGPRGPSGVGAISRVSQQTASSSAPSRSIQVSCPAGKSIVGGGAQIVGGGRQVALIASTPSGSAWQATAVETSSFSGRWVIKVTALCASAK